MATKYPKVKFTTPKGNLKWAFVTGKGKRMIKVVISMRSS